MIADLDLIPGLVFLTLVATAAIWDTGTYTIPNWLNLLLAAAFAVVAVVLVVSGRMPMGTATQHLATGLVMLGLGWALFSLNALGGGDAKLLAAASLWLGWPTVLPFVLVVAISGGILVILIMSFRGIPLPALFTAQNWITRLHDRNAGVPYGIAIAFGAIWAGTQSWLFEAARFG